MIITGKESRKQTKGKYKVLISGLDKDMLECPVILGKELRGKSRLTLKEKRLFQLRKEHICGGSGRLIEFQV